MAPKKRTTRQVRVFKSDIEQIQYKFPNVRMADFFHMAVKTNPFLQVEATLRDKKKKEKNRYK